MVLIHQISIEGNRVNGGQRSVSLSQVLLKNGKWACIDQLYFEKSARSNAYQLSQRFLEILNHSFIAATKRKAMFRLIRSQTLSLSPSWMTNRRWSFGTCVCFRSRIRHVLLKAGKTCSSDRLKIANLAFWLKRKMPAIPFQYKESLISKRWSSPPSAIAVRCGTNK